MGSAIFAALGLALFLLGSARIKPVETALKGAPDAPPAPLWVWLVCAVTPGPTTLVGGGVVMAAVFVHILRQARAGQAQSCCIAALHQAHDPPA